jgi:FolB domain-containing protein
MENEKLTEKYLQNYDYFDKIYIKDLLLRCILGINQEEREKKQDIVINIKIYTDLSASCRSDMIEDTVDYKKIKNSIISLVESSSFFLIEKLAQECADCCLQDSRVIAVKIFIEKPGALRFAKSAGIEILRSRYVK